MYTLTKKIQISASHRLKLDYESPCSNLHGHNWNIIVHCKSETLNQNGMIVDFMEIKRIVNKMDHANLNEMLGFNPTAENMAKYLCNEIPCCYKVEVEETDGNKVTYEKDED